MDSNTAAARMLSHSDNFFKSYPVQMAGGTGVFVPNAANLKIYYLAKKHAGMAGIDGKAGHFGATRPGFLHTKNISSFKMDMIASPNCSAPLNTHGVPMVNYNSDNAGKINLHTNIAAMDHYVVGAGANYMTTGLLTGCCFTWHQAGGDLWCTHIRPEGTDGITLQNMVALHGRFTAAPHQPLATFGRNDYGGTYAIVVGVNTPAGWKLYAQTSVDQFNTINAAWRIHPGAVTRL
jgi:hypothetical protein